MRINITIEMIARRATESTCKQYGKPLGTIAIIDPAHIDSDFGGIVDFAETETEAIQKARGYAVASDHIVTVTTESETKPETETKLETFESAMERFVDYITAQSEKDIEENYPALTPPVYRLTFGSVYAKVLKGRIVNYDDFVSESVFCFVRIANGDVLKAASYKAPAKHARGTIYTDNPENYGVSNYGARYLK